MQRKLSCSILLLLLIISVSANAQWTATLTATSSDTEVTPQTVTFGVANGATDGFDTGVDVSAAPKPPAPVKLDAVFPLSGNPFITRLTKDIRGPAFTTNWMYSLQADLQGGTLSWDVSTVPVTVVLKLTPPGESEIDMKTQSTVPYSALNGIVQNYTIAITDLSLPVELSAFTATRMPDGVSIRWRTESETNNLGFNIYRSETPNGKFEKINAVLIKGAGTDATPRDYQFVDEKIEPGKVYYYYIEDVDLSGNTDKSHLIKVGTSTPKGKLITRWGQLKSRY